MPTKLASLPSVKRKQKQSEKRSEAAVETTPTQLMLTPTMPQLEDPARWCRNLSSNMIPI